MAPMSASLRAALVAATAVEAYAGASLTLAPARFIRTTYGVRGVVDAIALKFARTAGIALSCLGVLSGLCAAAQDAPPAALTTLVLYNAGACANNVAQPGGAVAALVHGALAAWLFVARPR